MFLLQCSTQPADSLGSDGSALSGEEGMAERLWEDLRLRMLQLSRVPMLTAWTQNYAALTMLIRETSGEGESKNNKGKGGEERK